MKKTPVRPELQTSDQFWRVITDVFHQRIKRADMMLSIETGGGFTLAIYRVNEAVPVRVDFKPKKEETR